MTTPRQRRQVRFSPQGSPKHSWSVTDRLVLIILVLCYRNHASDLAMIFNHINRRRLAAEGFKRGIPTTSLTAQLHEYRNSGTGSKIYQAISVFTLDDLRSIFTNQFGTIARAAYRLGIHLIERASSEPERPQTSIPHRLRRIRNSVTPSETTVTTWVPNSDEEDVEEYDYTPTRKSRKNHATQTNGLRSSYKFLPSKILRDKTDPNSRRRPYFLYRAFEVQHGLRSRQFLNDGCKIPPPPGFGSRAFCEKVKPHLERNLRYCSPFLSFAENPSVAVKHAFEKASAGVEIALAIYKYDDLEMDAITRFGLQNGPYLVPVICDTHNLDDLPGGYRGNGEFLFWGSVNVEPITKLSGVDTLMIRAIMDTTRTLNFASGARLNKYLPEEISDEHSELFVHQLIKSFEKANPYQTRNSSAYLDYLRGAGIDISRLAINNEYVMVEYDNVAGSSSEPELVDAEEPEQPVIAEDTQMVDFDSASDSDSDSDCQIVWSQPVGPKQNVFPLSAWRSDTASDIY